MSIYDKLKDTFISALREIAGLGEDRAKKELSALEFELRKLAEKVERGEHSLEDAIKEVTKKVEIYSPPAFRQKVRGGVREYQKGQVTQEERVDSRMAQREFC